MNFWGYVCIRHRNVFTRSCLIQYSSSTNSLISSFYVVKLSWWAHLEILTHCVDLKFGSFTCTFIFPYLVFNVLRKDFFPTPPCLDQLWDLPSVLSKGFWGLLKWPDHEANQSPPSRAEIKNASSFTYCSPLHLHNWCLGNITFISTSVFTCVSNWKL